MKRKLLHPSQRSLIVDWGRILLAGFVVVHAVLNAHGQSEVTQSNAKATALQNSSSAELFESEGGMSAARRKMMDDALAEPRKVAAAVVAADFPSPQFIVQVGAFQGEFLEVFLDRFPSARGQWTEAITSEHNLAATKQRFARFGNRIDFAFGCARRDLSAGCVLPKQTDVILLEWLSIQQDLDGMYKVYRAGAAQLPQGGWIVNVDHVKFGGNGWEPLVKTAVKEFRHPEVEGPPIHYPQFQVPTADEQLAAMRAAGFDAQVVWQSFNTVLFMGRKK
jgi:hypothetical protein